MPRAYSTVMHLDAQRSIGCIDLRLQLIKFSSSCRTFERFHVKVEAESLCLPPSIHRFNELVQRYDYLKMHHLSSFVARFVSMHRMHRMRGKSRCCIDAHFRATGHFFDFLSKTSHWTTRESFIFRKCPCVLHFNIFFMHQMNQLHRSNCGNWMRKC